ncbi:MAG: hypothetical protein E6614_10295, partial [Bradyrhizobium sp.]|nr:hypothetical protein [Bradyrhizobium sp.]
PMAAALSVTHGFLPPHPGPTAIATLFNADMGKTLLWGTLLGIPTVVDRFIQQAVLQVLHGEWDRTFSDASYGSGQAARRIRR